MLTVMAARTQEVKTMETTHSDAHMCFKLYMIAVAIAASLFVCPL